MNLTSISEIKKREETEEASQTELCFEEKTHQEGSFLRLLDRQDELEIKVGSR